MQYRQVLLRKLGGVKKIIYEAKTRKSSCHKTRTESLAKELSSLLVTKNGLRSCVSLLYDPCQRRCHNCQPRLSIHSQWGELFFQGGSYFHTVACIIVRRLLISVHKWQCSGMADTHEYWFQHDAHLVYLPIFHGLNLIIFS